VSRRRARRLLAPLVFVLALAGAPPACAAALAPEQVTLRLPDLPPGFEVSSSAVVINGFPQRPDRCEPRRLGDLPVQPAVRTLAARFPHRGCEITFDQAWPAPGLVPFPSLVGSAAFVFADPAGTQAALQQGQAIAAAVLGVDARWLPPLPSPAALGDEARLYGFFDSSVVVVWRSGPVLSLVLALGAREQVLPAALVLAAAQQARIDHPTPLRQSEIDDLEVPFGHPRLDVPVHWLGRRLPGRDHRPALRLISVDGPIFSPIEPEPRMTLHYGSRLHSTFVDVSLWDPGRLRRLMRRGDPDCTRHYAVHLDGMRATIVGSSSFVGDRCRRPPRHPTFLSAIAYFPGVTVAIQADHWRRYDSPTGLRALLRALRPRLPTP
jgi:hypothetical protein